MTPEQLALVNEWHRAKASLAQWEAYERDLRGRLVNSLFGDYGDGTRSIEIANGWKLSNLNSTRHDVKDCPELRQLVRNFSNYGSTAEAGASLLKDKPRLSLRAYKVLPQWGRALLVPYVTTTPQLPQLTVIPPKG